MKQEILLNKKFSTNENISATASSLDYRYGYFINYNTGQGSLTSQFNVQAFINDPSNLIVVGGFETYLNNNFTQSQITAIKSDNQSLSNALNFFYENYIANIVSNLPSNPNQPGVTSTGQSFDNNLYFVNDNKSNFLSNGVIYSNSADSYYLNVSLFENSGLLDDSDIFLEPNVNNGFQIEKEVVQLNGLILSGHPVFKRTATISANKQELIQGFVDINLLDSPFNNYSNYGLDFAIITFSGQTVYNIDAELVGNIGATETISPSGITDVLIGKNQTFVFKTISPTKSIQWVSIDGNKVDYDRDGNLSKSVAGLYTFNKLTENHTITVSFA